MAKGYKELVADAEAVIETWTVERALAEYGKPGVTFVDLRDVRELQREGRIPGALHAPRGMLEFWIDRDSPYHREQFASGDRFVFFCAAGWRSALATRTALEMGLEPVCHIAGGFGAWREAGGAVAPLPERSPPKQG
ncbi:rhodanese-like domain-containing protein [Oceanibacterium hippocampi]|uniref:Molybdopterin biosynthesis protein MoeB n=1 Tax=Oceanibacterium hippocampi TaxID=745714 RepID=A0A1Y5S8A3_9PROT|nr:rhodanese-like domain-containing protein [Oceanibacterium hippocampi]SLN34603.1 molybdopterin biosynthesis protein MoeB [Oceanibacterium hippocampi]